MAMPRLPPKSMTPMPSSKISFRVSPNTAHIGSAMRSDYRDTSGQIGHVERVGCVIWSHKFSVFGPPWFRTLGLRMPVCESQSSH